MTTEQQPEYIITTATKAKLIDYANAEDAEACIRDILDRECRPYAAISEETCPLKSHDVCAFAMVGQSNNHWKIFCPNVVKAGNCPIFNVAENAARAATLAILDASIAELTKIKEKFAAMEMSDVSLKLSQRYGAARLGVEASIKVLQLLRKKQEQHP